MNGLDPRQEALLSEKGQKALASMEKCGRFDLMASVHKDSFALRNFAERLKRKSGFKESIARFELDLTTGKINLSLYDAQTGEMHLKLTPEEVEEGLKNLEETEDNHSPLSEFFLDIKPET